LGGGDQEIIIGCQPRQKVYQDPVSINKQGMAVSVPVPVMKEAVDRRISM
jgi:hypothetical protein